MTLHTSLSISPPASLPTSPPAASPPTSTSTSLQINSGGSIASLILTHTILSKLTFAATQLLISVPVAEPEDAIAALCGDPEGILSTLEDEEPYEWLDKKLNNICGSWAVNHGYIPLAIKHGDLGLLGLCHTLQFFIDHKCQSMCKWM